MKCERADRTLHLTELPSTVEGVKIPTELSVEIRYVGEEACTRKAIALDNVVIPAIVDALGLDTRPPVRWDAWVSGLDGQALDALSRELDAIALFAARRAAYVHARALGRPHATAVSRSNTAVRRLAAKLGFSYPASHELRF